jgi:restriction endonuclease S subunit
MNLDTLLENFTILAEAPDGISKLRLLIVELAIHGKLSNPEKINDNGYPSTWNISTASEFFKSRSGNSKLIKGKLFDDFVEGRYPGYSASGQDVWLDSAEHCGEAAILSAVGARCGKAFRASGDWSAIANTHIIWLNDYRVEPDYGMLILNNENFWIRSGSAQPFVKVKASLEQTIGIPPLAEQKRIVEVVDKLMTLCGQLEQLQQNRASIRVATRKSVIDAISTASTPEELETAWNRISNNWDVIADAPESAATLRSLVLDLAVTGSLVPDNKDSISIVESLGLSQEDFTFSPMRANWINTKMDKCFQISGGIQKTPKRSPKQNAFPYLRVANVHRGTLDLNEISKFELESGELERYKLEEGDLLIVEGNGSQSEIGRCARWTGEIPNCVHQNHIIRCRPKILGLEDFVMLYLNSSIGKKTMTELAITTSGLYSLSVGKIRNITISIPPLSLQKQIVAKVKVLMALCDELETAIEIRSALAEKFARSVVSAA